MLDRRIIIGVVVIITILLIGYLATRKKTEGAKSKKSKSKSRLATLVDNVKKTVTDAVLPPKQPAMPATPAQPATPARPATPATPATPARPPVTTMPGAQMPAPTPTPAQSPMTPPAPMSLAKQQANAASDVATREAIRARKAADDAVLRAATSSNEYSRLNAEFANASAAARTATEKARLDATVAASAKIDADRAEADRKEAISNAGPGGSATESDVTMATNAAFLAGQRAIGAANTAAASQKVATDANNKVSIISGLMSTALKQASSDSAIADGAKRYAMNAENAAKLATSIAAQTK